MLFRSNLSYQMMVYTKSFRTEIIALTIVIISSFISLRGFSQDWEQLFLKYKNEQAVITNIKEQMIIKDEKGVLVANSIISKEKMLIGELSPGIYNKEYIFHSYFNKLTDYDVAALIFNNSAYKNLDNFTEKTTNSEDGNVFYDDLKQTEIT